METYLLKPKITFFLIVVPIFFVSIFLFAEVGYSQEEGIAKFPSRPITFIFGYPPGTSPDLATRLICKEAEKFLGQPVVILNKTGLPGLLAMPPLPHPSRMDIPLAMLDKVPRLP